MSRPCSIESMFAKSWVRQGEISEALQPVRIGSSFKPRVKGKSPVPFWLREVISVFHAAEDYQTQHLEQINALEGLGEKILTAGDIILGEFT